jgi:hypothetical protein
MKSEQYVLSGNSAGLIHEFLFRVSAEYRQRLVEWTNHKGEQTRALDNHIILNWTTLGMSLEFAVVEFVPRPETVRTPEQTQVAAYEAY